MVLARSETGQSGYFRGSFEKGVEGTKVHGRRL